MRWQYRESITLLFEGSRRAIPFNILLGALLALELLYNQVPPLFIGAWLSAIVIASAARWIFCHYSLQMGSEERKTGWILVIFILLTFLMGTVWGASYWLMLPYVTELHEFIIILVLGGMCAGSIASLSACLPAYYTYIIPMFLPVIVYNYWLSSIDRAILATMFLLFVVMLVVSATINNRVIKQIFQLSREKEILIDELKVLSITDSLTGLYNRRHFESVLQEELSRAKRNRYSLILVLIDIDNFKSFNDCFGHPYGDKILISTANRLQRTFRRANDTVFRIGGDEFSAILANQSIQEAITLCNTLITQLNMAVSWEGNQALEEVLKKISLSIGVVSIPFDYQSNDEQLITAVDKALYQAPIQK